jgi:hemolysin III
MRLASLFAYLFIAWLLVLAIRPLVAAVPPGGLWLLLGGAVSYFVGMLFWRWRGLRFHTTYRQAFFLMGSTCHCLAVLLFLLPR